MAGSSPQLLQFTHICLASTCPKSGAVFLMWSRNTSSREELLHLTWSYSANAASDSICCLLQGHAASLWVCRDLWDILGKEGSAALVCLTTYLCALSLNLSCSATGQHFPCLFLHYPCNGRSLPCCPRCPFPLSAPGELWLSKHHHCIPVQQILNPSFASCSCSHLPSTAHSK